MVAILSPMRAFLIFALCLSAPAVALADTVTMKNGDVYRGKVIKQEPDQYVQILLKDDNEKRLQWVDIGIVEINEPPKSAPVPEATPPAPSSAEHRHGEVRLYPGIVFGTATNLSFQNSSGSTVANSFERDSSSEQIGMEAGLINPSGHFGLFAVAEWNPYNYGVGSPRDTETAIYFEPKVIATDIDGFSRVWFGTGFGFILTSIGQPTETVGSTSVSVGSWNLGVAVTPRVGIDVDILSNLFIGVQLNAVAAFGAINGTVSSQGGSGNFTVDITRWWWGANAAVGLRF